MGYRIGGLVNEWETFESNYTYSTNGSKYQQLKKSSLKECFIVRYADDFTR